MRLPRPRPTGAQRWPVLTVDRLNRGTLRALLDNRIAAIRRPGLVDPQTCAASVRVMLASDAWDHYDLDGPQTGKLGISQYAYADRKASYFADTATALARRAQVVESMPDPLDLVRSELAAAWPAQVDIADEDGQPYFAGVFRSSGDGGLRPHADWGPRDGPGWTIEDIVAQLAWNLYYTVPDVGGELLIYDRPWTPDLERDARQHAYDYNPARLAGCHRVEVNPKAGDLVVFSASNVHAVAEALAGAHRIAASSFVGERPDGSLLLWS